MQNFNKYSETTIKIPKKRFLGYKGKKARFRVEDFGGEFYRIPINAIIRTRNLKAKTPTQTNLEYLQVTFKNWAYSIGNDGNQLRKVIFLLKQKTDSIVKLNK